MSVAIVMGSDSDEPIMKGAVEALEKFGIEWDMRVLSAHRTPDDAVAFSRSAKERGVEVIIAGAGGSAHLAGVLAAVTTLPVIGVPISLKNLDGMDSLLSIVQMPQGIPVATVAIDGAHNAGLLAVRMIGIANAEVSAAITKFQADMTESVKAKDAAMQKRLGR